MHEEFLGYFLHCVKLCVGILPNMLHKNLCAVISQLPFFALGKRGEGLFPEVSGSSGARTYGGIGNGGRILSLLATSQHSDIKLRVT